MTAVLRERRSAVVCFSVLFDALQNEAPGGWGGALDATDDGRKPLMCLSGPPRRSVGCPPGSGGKALGAPHGFFSRCFFFVFLSPELVWVLSYWSMVAHEQSRREDRCPLDLERRAG